MGCAPSVGSTVDARSLVRFSATTAFAVVPSASIVCKYVQAQGDLVRTYVVG